MFGFESFSASWKQTYADHETINVRLKRGNNDLNDQ